MLTAGFEPIPGYRLETFLGRGQFGEVWRASSPGGTHVALKFLNVRERQGRKEFRAIQKVKGIRHPHLVLTYALWLLDESMLVIDDAAFDNNPSLLNDTFGATLHRLPVRQADSQKPFMLVIATVLCEHNLMERLREYNQRGERGVPFQELIGYIEDAAKAIDFLNTPRHDLGDGPVAIHHCDIKPENIMVLGDLAVVGDFGVARILASGVDSRTTSMAGSVAYAAPETFDNRIEATSDQYSLAITYYELRTGKLPFPEESQAQVIRDKLAGHLDFSHVSHGEANVLKRAMAVAPGSRYPTARAFVDALRSAGGDMPQRSRLLPKLAKLALFVAFLMGLVSSAAWYFKLGPYYVARETIPDESIPDETIPDETKPDETKPDENTLARTKPEEKKPEVKEKPDTEVANRTSTITEPEKENPKVELKPPQPRKQLVVSISGNGTHKSIASAIAESKVGETIRIQQGTYRESIEIPRSITLIGEGSVRVSSSSESCIKVRNESSVRIQNVVFDSKSSKSSAIDIESGSMELIGCSIFASSLNSLYGLTLGTKGIVIAEKCKWECVAGKAVVAEKGASVTLRDCSIRFVGNSSTSAPLIGVQGNGARGLIQGCSFNGPCNVGIDWTNCSDQLLQVESCVLDRCEIGIQTRSCNDVIIKGTQDRACKVVDAKWGLNLERSNVNVSMIKVDGMQGRNMIAMRITDRSSVNCTDGQFNGNECGILARQSAVVVDGVSITSARYAGMFVDGSTIGGKALMLAKIAKYGLVVYSKGSSVNVNSLGIVAEPNLRDKGILAVYAGAGRIEFQQGDMQGFVCAFFVDPEREFIGKELPDKRVLDQLLLGAVSADGSATKVEIVADQLTLKNCDNTWTFNGAGSSRIKQLICDLAVDRQSPFLLKKEQFQRLGDDLTRFEVLETKNK